MRRLPPLVFSLFVAGLGVASPAAAQDEDDDEGVHGVVRQRIVALLNPMGVEHQTSLGLRAPLGDQDELLFGGAHAEAGIVNYLSPVYSMQGGYLEVSPLSFLVLRAELTGTVMWPIGMDAAGYFGVESYAADVRGQALPGDEGDTATGWSVALSARLQGRIPLGGPFNLLIANDTRFQHDTLGDSPFYYSQKHDLILARQDWVVLNDAVVFVEAELEPDLRFLGGAFSDLRVVPRSGYVGHQLGPILALTFHEVSDEVDSITPFIRGGYYTHHVYRTDELTVLGGVSVNYDLGGL